MENHLSNVDVSFLDYKRARAELKKRSTDTLRLQKKARKCASGDLQRRLECGLQDVTERRQLFEEAEKRAVRAALVEERGRFCTFVGFLKPVVVRQSFFKIGNAAILKFDRFSSIKSERCCRIVLSKPIDSILKVATLRAHSFDVYSNHQF